MLWEHSKLYIAYIATAKAPLSNSDHNVIHLIPIYRSVLRRSKPIVRTVKIWSTNSIETLKGCYLSTNWDIFHEPDLNISTDVITSYINFCVEAVIPHKTIKIYLNNKPYINKDIKDCIRRKGLAFKSKDQRQQRAVQKELNQKLNIAKRQYKGSIEKDFNANNTKKMWDTMKSITNLNPARKALHSTDDSFMANELNNFYLRFDTQELFHECDNVISTIPVGGDTQKIDIDHTEVLKLFKRLDTNKAAGPDGVSSFLLKTCAEELTPAWVPVYQRSVDSHTVPSLWKRATIIPLPKKSGSPGKQGF